MWNVNKKSEKCFTRQPTKRPSTSIRPPKTKKPTTMWQKSTPEPTQPISSGKCNYHSNNNNNNNNECDDGYKCVKDNEY